MARRNIIKRFDPEQQGLRSVAKQGQIRHLAAHVGDDWGWEHLMFWPSGQLYESISVQDWWWPYGNTLVCMLAGEPKVTQWSACLLVSWWSQSGPHACCWANGNIVVCMLAGGPVVTQWSACLLVSWWSHSGLNTCRPHRVASRYTCCSCRLGTTHSVANGTFVSNESSEDGIMTLTLRWWHAPLSFAVESKKN